MSKEEGLRPSSIFPGVHPGQGSGTITTIDVIVAEDPGTTRKDSQVAPGSPVIRRDEAHDDNEGLLSTAPGKIYCSESKTKVLFAIFVVTILATAAGVILLISVPLRRATPKELSPNSVLTPISPELDTLVVVSAGALLHALEYKIVVIESLTEDLNKLENRSEIIKQGRFVKNVTISGPTSEEWLVFLLESWTRIEILSLDMDQLCMGSQVRNRDELKPLTLAAVKSLSIANSNICVMSSWIFKWDLHNLEKIQISNSDLSSVFHEELKAFLDKIGGSLREVEISNCHMCPGCDFVDLDEASPNATLTIRDMSWQMSPED